MRGFFSFSLNEQATKEKKQKKVAEIYLIYAQFFFCASPAKVRMEKDVEIPAIKAEGCLPFIFI